MAYKYLNTARINSALKKFKLKVHVTPTKAICLADIDSGEALTELKVKKLHELTMNQWREAAQAVRENKTSAEEKNASEAIRELLAN
jgi:hypothetical protein